MANFELNRLIDSINLKVKEVVKIMEVCGTHTQAIAKSGLSTVLDPRLKLISGPGCPVCVTHEGFIDAAIELLQQPNTIIATFGDLIRVKGSNKSLEDCMEMKDRIKVVYSPFTALNIAESNRDKKVIFLAVGFETTAPVIAAIVKLAVQTGLKNLFLLVGLKLMPPVLEKVLSAEDNRLDALICPGHVAVIMGSEYFSFVPEKYGIPAVISGFEYRDVAAAVYYLSVAAGRREKSLSNLYAKCVRPNGNVEAKKLISETFDTTRGYWRGIGNIENSELTLSKEFKAFDASEHFGVIIRDTISSTNCQCGEIITGSKNPFECSLFGKVCTLEEPKGPCMVSAEGACAIYYKYKRSDLT